MEIMNTMIRSGSRVVVLGLLVLQFSWLAFGNFVIPVQHKFQGQERTLNALNAHDAIRHGRELSAVDMSMGGSLERTGLYHTKVGIGSPPQEYKVYVDTGSDLLWVNCVYCRRGCPNKSHDGVEIKLYDPRSSKSSELITCVDDFCTALVNNTGFDVPNCHKKSPCPFLYVYGDGSRIHGYIVKDKITFDQVSGDLQTSPAINSDVKFGCGAMVSGPQPHGLGLVGFGQDKTSLISQLASTGNVKKVFSHCLDSTKGGGIFAIGEVVQPIVKTTPIVDQFKYIIVANGVDVGGQVLQLPPEAFENGYGRDAMVDSGAALTFLPDNILEPLIAKIMAGKPGLKVFMNPGNFACFNYTGDIGYDEFPNVTFHFEGSLSLTIHPHNYILPNNEWNNVTEWCLGWRSGKDNSQFGLPEIILGEVALMDKLVLYDLEKQVIGWTQYNCSSSIKVREGSSGAVYSVNSHNIFQSTEH